MPLQNPTNILHIFPHPRSVLDTIFMSTVIHIFVTLGLHLFTFETVQEIYSCGPRQRPALYLCAYNNETSRYL